MAVLETIENPNKHFVIPFRTSRVMLREMKPQAKRTTKRGVTQMSDFQPVQKVNATELKRIKDGALAMRVRRLAAYPENVSASIAKECDSDDYILCRDDQEWKDAYQAASTEAGKRNIIITFG